MAISGNFIWNDQLFFYLTKENNIFSISTTGYWSSRGGAGTTHKLQNLSELLSQIDIELQVEEATKRRNQIQIEENKYKLSDLDTHKNEISEELKNLEYIDLEDMVFRMELPCSEIEKTLDVKYIPTSSTGYTLPP